MLKHGLIYSGPREETKILGNVFTTPSSMSLIIKKQNNYKADSTQHSNPNKKTHPLGHHNP